MPRVRPGGLCALTWCGMGVRRLRHGAGHGVLMWAAGRRCGAGRRAWSEQGETVLVSASVPGAAGGDLMVHEQARTGGVAEADGMGQLVPEDGERVLGGGVRSGEVG